ncbi:hypothetical protein [Sphingomonas pruni]|jgi:Spy/CpxP family protein refolding chaperone|uniref:hypothetical protein n=1 Tax=Sphingomonas pruni TaxID=40683 RepID=UPI000AED1C87|nr:hypothetical protein [Sphingomonas pruni]
MKLLAVVAAGILAASALTPVTSASAAPAPDRWSHGHHHGWKWKKVCTVRWHHGHKVRTCRKVRVRW